MAVQFHLKSGVNSKCGNNETRNEPHGIMHLYSIYSCNRSYKTSNHSARGIHFIVHLHLVFFSFSEHSPTIKVALTSWTFSPWRVPVMTLLFEAPFPWIESRRNWIGSAGEVSSGVKRSLKYARILSSSPLLYEKVELWVRIEGSSWLTKCKEGVGAIGIN